MQIEKMMKRVVAKDFMGGASLHCTSFGQIETDGGVLIEDRCSVRFRNCNATKMHAGREGG